MYEWCKTHWNSISSTQFIVWPPLWFPTTAHHMSQHLQQHRNRLTLEEHVHVVNVQWNASIFFLCSTWSHVVSNHSTRSTSERSRRQWISKSSTQVKSTMPKRKKGLRANTVVTKFFFHNILTSCLHCLISHVTVRTHPSTPLHFCRHTHTHKCK